MKRNSVQKTLSYWLRHKPEAGGLTLDAQGWADVEQVLAALNSAIPGGVSAEQLAAVVDGSEKQRFTLADGRIRANQGHSIDAELDFRPVKPPAVLYHGTTQERWQRIQSSGGLSRMNRHHVHLSPDTETARRVAGRHRKEAPLVLRVDAAAMQAAGHTFFISANSVYLTDAVPLAFLVAE
jgi:putative RNA 2'-phosphotransferase